MNFAEGAAPTLFRAARATRLVRTFSILGAMLLLLPAAAALAASHAKTKVASHVKTTAADHSFQLFIESVWPEARAHGVSRKTFDLAFRGVTYDAKVVANTNAQAEFVKPIWEYLASAVSTNRIERAEAAAQQYQSWLSKAQHKFGVDASVVTGIWGMETDFGAFAGSDYVIRALASLAYVHYRGDYFKDELIAALQILEEGDITPARMKGSWAGAMGQTQFMPSSFREYAVDFDGAGRRDIWTSAPDAIGSTANYLAKHGWILGQPWGFEVILPEGFDLKDADSSHYASFSAFAERGVKRADGKAMPQSGEAELLITAGLKGPIFLVTPNFKVIKSYNNSTSYALGVALLGDRAMGGGPLQAAWPIHDPQLSAAQMREMQTRLKKMGYDVGELDGKIGESGRAALRAYQEKTGLIPDGYPTLVLLSKMRK
ncbi:lytic murein transglycosylase [Methylocapsa sp. S129]|uniref:lytic murein transglycosylase n=1 Tax=Methylocapsa sp. S129 TaxID=1641869 RepID=UPI001FEFF119|nr:lytic murein transglycosylase [Methylocapsa sp. S129]